ncbi:MAG: hypothetical protein OM95_06875 [Bdellovibrio sp. ArHS]|uniref:hypothetical protein n=1 Tax=Bdellovibrio sp. ArHS TaxID=1569284 RepID=UPI000582D4BD|nr:hypothetical protein [Bdellovibrio sp. ArHS]KHD88833.1 MAG: hypothetical protein OM95_06875 [Bdellovibrio sp. ArHS]
MTNLKVKNKQLAKLREFRKGMDVEDFLQNEFKQILRALQNQFVSVDESPGESTMVMLGSADLYAQNVPSFGVGTVSLTDRVLKSGSVTSNVFYPSSSGKFWIEYGCEFAPGTSGTVTNNLIAKNSSGTAVHTLQKRVDTTIGGPKYVTGKFLMNLTTTLGVYFDFTGDSNTVGSNFYCSITRVS